MNTPKLRSIQVLRAIAATSVVVLHANTEYERYYNQHSLKTDYSAPEWNFILSSGVELFFIISGFIITYQFNAGINRSPSQFLLRRLIRIFPLYWLLTFLYLALLAIFPDQFNTHKLDFSYSIHSLILVPYESFDGTAYPYIGVAWTLSYELVFYFLFCLVLFLNFFKRATLPVLVAITIWFLVGHHPSLINLTPLIHTSREIIFCFALGILIAHTHNRNPIQEKLLILFPVAIFCFYISSQHPEIENNVVQSGLPSALLVISFLALEKHLGTRPFNTLITIGNASYSVYLIQVFTFPVLYKLIGQMNFFVSIHFFCVVALTSTITVLLGYLLYLLVERPLLVFCKRSI